MSYMSNNNSRALMGFSVHQPALGAALQFFPAMGSEQLDEMIDAYVPGSASILDKRTAVSLEFFEHTMQTGELFKFFLVYPAVSPNTASPASTMQDSGYGSSFNTSPVMAESQWTQMSRGSFSSSSASTKAKASSKQAASSASRAQAQDFSHIPGMKIMTKDGLDVTNSASRGCKTKEQRDHAHLMRIIKACDSCKRKKTRCDPSHKKRSSSASSSSPEPKAAKKVKKSAAPSSKKAPPPASIADISFDSCFDPTMPDSFSFDADFMATTEISMDDWDQYIKYDENVNDVIPQDYDFFFDPAGYFSPTTDKSTSASLSPSQILTPGGLSQPLTPASGLEIGSGVERVGADLTGLGESHQPMLPYLNAGGVEVGNNYVDFALYSPGSTCLDDDPALSTEVAAPLGPDYYEYQHSSSNYRPDQRSVVRDGVSSSPQDSAPLVAQALLRGQVDHNQFATESSGSHFVQQGLVQLSDQGRLDEDYDRDQRHQQSSDSSAKAGVSYTGAPLDVPNPRVPTMTVSPRDTLLGVSHSAVQALPAGSGSVASADVLAQSVKRSSSRQSLAIASTDTFDELVTAHGLSPTIVRTPVVPLTATATDTGVAVSLVSPGVERRRVGIVNQQASDLHHQQLSVAPALRNAGDAVVDTGDTGATDYVQQHVSSTDAFANDLAQTVVRESGAQVVTALQKRTSWYYSTGLAQSQTQSALSSSVVAQATNSPVAEHPDGVLTGVFPAGGLFALSAALGLGLKGTSPAAVGKPGAAVLGALPLVAMLSSVVVLALVFHALSSTLSSLRGDISLPLIGATLIAASSAAVSPSPQQYSVSCMNKLDPFTQALHVFKRMSGNAIDNVKSQIHGVQSRILNIQRRAESGRAINRYNIGSNAVSRLGVVY